MRTEDRPGLLGRIVTAVAEAGARVDWVLVRTRGNAVEDVFALPGLKGTPEIGTVVEALLPRREPTPPPGGGADTL